MRRTTILLPDDLQAGIAHIAATERRSEAEVILDAVREAVARRTPPTPKLPLFEGGLRHPGVSERVDDALEGFGQR